MIQNRGKKYTRIIIYYITEPIMQQCNICSSNPNNKTYNYHMFEPDEYAKPTRPSNGIIIEGLDAVAQSSIVTDSTTEFNDSYAKYLECSDPNAAYCISLAEQYKTQSQTVIDLEPEYNDASKAYNTCNNHKNTCTGITSTIDNILKNIKDYDTKIEAKQELLNTCDFLKEECDKKKQAIQDKITQIENLRIQINANKQIYDENKCGTYYRNKNDSDRIILNKPLFFYGNREEGCNALSAVIDKQERLLNQYNTELTSLNTQYADCDAKYKNTCSVEERNELTALIAKRDEESKQLDKKYAEYDSECKDKIQDCEPLLTVFQQKTAVYDDETKKKNKLDDEYKTCMDPTKNKCKDLYKDANFNKSVTETSIDMLKPSTTKSNEGFTQYSSTDNADVTHTKLIANYKSVQNDYTKLKNNVQDFNSANNNGVGKTSRYAAKKQLYDNAIYTNILLTALATSVVYYIFTDL